jgi:hypothetical protein
MALAGYYGGIDDLVDGLVESYQGKYGIIKNYESFKVSSYKDNSQLQAYFKTLDKEVTKLRADTDKDTYLANQVDTVVELIQSTLYKLAFLK